MQTQADEIVKDREKKKAEIVTLKMDVDIMQAELRKAAETGKDRISALEQQVVLVQDQLTKKDKFYK